MNGRSNPYQYRVEVLLKENATLKDSLSQPLGIRYYAVRKDSGFYLNGKRYPLYGVNLHEDRIDKGRAISDADRLEDMYILSEMGLNFLRLSHYQHDQYTYNLADKNGMVVWTEIPMINSISGTSTFANNIKEQLKELVRQNYNHPSVFFWGLYNEILLKAGPDPATLIKELNVLAHQEDPTRLTTAASNKDDSGINLLTDLVSFNKYYGWYMGTPKNFDDWLTSLKLKPLSLPVGLSEYGAGASVKHHELYPVMPNTNSDWHPEELSNLFHEQYWRSIKKTPSLWQTSAWVAFDFASDSRSEGDRPGINDKGFVTQDRKIKKDAFYFYKSNWSKDPVLYITSRRFSERTNPLTYIKVYSNCDSVRLTVNKMFLGSQKNSENIFQWNNIILEPGVNIIKVRGYKNNRVYSDSCIWRYDALKLQSNIRINFQTSTTKTPDGYFADTGLTFASRGNSLTYGWQQDNTANAVEKNLWADKLYNSYAQFLKNSVSNVWEIQLKNGTYLLRMVAGDPVFSDINYKITAEEKIIVNGKPSKEMPWLVSEDTVNVKDGKLTIRAASDALNSKINFIHITRTDSTNLGMGKKVTQSSIAYGGYPERAIDGNTDGAWANHSISSTNNELNAWWELDLGENYPLSTLQLWNRTDFCCKSNLINYYVFASSEPFQSKQLTTTLNQPGVWNTFKSTSPNPYVTIAVNRSARYIRVQLAGTGTLNLAEAIVMGKAKFPPAIPSALKATWSTSINLSWNDNSNNEQGFIVERKMSGSTFEQLANLLPGTTSYADSKDLKTGVTYIYRVKAFNNDGSSGYSNEVSISSAPSSELTNLALFKPATQSSTSYSAVAGRAVDGNTDGAFSHGSVTHTASALNSWWEVDLGDIYKINNIKIWNRTDLCCKTRMANYYVLVSNEPFNSKILGTTLSQPGVWNVFKADYPDPSSTIDVNRTGRYVRIQLAGTAELNMAEVQVMGTLQVSATNVALNKATTQSSTVYGGVAERAVDGITDGLWAGNSVTHTASNLNAWWEVDLGNTYSISTVEIWNRTNSCCVSRLSNYYLFVSSEPFVSKQLTTTLNQTGVWNAYKTEYPDPSTLFTVNKTGRYVRVQLSGTAELNLAEVKVFGIPSQLKSQSFANTLEKKILTSDDDSLHITIYPVPFTNNIHVISSEPMEKVEIYNVLGKKLLETILNDESAELNTQMLSPGFYVIRVYLANKKIKVIHVIRN